MLRAAGFGDWKVKGKALPRSRKFKYLGVELHDVTGTKGSVEHRLRCMIAAPHSAVSRRLNDMQCPKDYSTRSGACESTPATSRYVQLQ